MVVMCKGGVHMAFERKNVAKENSTNHFWQIFQWYLIIVPVLYLIFVMPNVFQRGGSEAIAYTSVARLFLHVLNLGVGGVIYLTHPSERAKNGAAKNLLIMAMIQQLVTQNLFGFGLAIIAWYKLPLVAPAVSVIKAENEQKSLQPKFLYGLMILLILLTSLVVLSIYMFN